MEQTLGGVFEGVNADNTIVLILVLMEHTLGVVLQLEYELLFQS